MQPIFMKEGLAKRVYESKELKDGIKRVNDYYREHKQKMAYHLRTEKENFYLETFRAMSHVDNKLTELSACKQFLSSYPSNLKIAKVMSRDKYIIYHLEYYYIGIIALYDRSLKLVNHLCGLGLDDRDTSHAVMIRHEHLSAKLKEVLKKFYEGSKHIRTIQNDVKHKSSMVIDELSDASMFEFLSAAASLPSMKDLDLDQQELRFLAKLGYRKYISKKLKELRENEESLSGFISNLLRELEKPFEERLVRLG